MGNNPDEEALRKIESNLAGEDADFVRAFKTPAGTFMRRHCERIVSLSIIVIVLLSVLMIVAGLAAQAWLLCILAGALAIWSHRVPIRRWLAPPQR